MSAPNEPYANGFGILVGIGILWVGTLLLLILGKLAWDSFTGSDEEEAALRAPVERVETGAATNPAIAWRARLEASGPDVRTF